MIRYWSVFLLLFPSLIVFSLVAVPAVSANDYIDFILILIYELNI